MPQFEIVDAPTPRAPAASAPKFEIADAPAAGPRFEIADQAPSIWDKLGIKPVNEWLNRQVQPITETINRTLAPVRGGAPPGSLPPEAAAVRPVPTQAAPPEDPATNFQARAALERRLRAEGKDPRQDPEWQRLVRGQGEQQRHEGEVAAQFLPLGLPRTGLGRAQAAASPTAIESVAKAPEARTAPRSGAAEGVKSVTPPTPKFEVVDAPQPRAAAATEGLRPDTISATPETRARPAGATEGARPLAGSTPQGGRLRSSYIPNAIERALSPSTVTEEAASAAGTIRAGGGKLAQDTAQAAEALKASRALVNKLPDADRLAFIDSIETGAKQPSAELQGVADGIRAALKDRETKIKSLGPGYLDSAIENYFPHIWERPQAGARGPLEAAMAAGQSKAPYKGSGSFLKQRTFATVREGMEAGFRPVTTDPIDLTLIKLREMDKFYYGEQALRTLDQDGLIRRVKLGERAPIGWEKVNDPSVSKLPYATYAPPEVARVFNNYVSRGLVGEPLYDVMRYAGNALNQLQLGLSGFHAFFTSMDTMVSRVGLGLEQAVRGEVGRGVKTALKGFSPSTPVTTALKGGRLKEAYLNPQGATPEMQRMVNALTEAGGRISMDQFYAASPSRGFISSLRDGTLMNDVRQTFRDHPYAGALKVPFDIATRAIRDVSHPLMEWLVPRQKLGVFYDMAQDWMRAHPNAGAAEMRTAMQSIWDSVDNRLGQLAYDNLFWPKVQKDIAFLTTRSVGWNLGTIRELGGGAMDTARAAGSLAKGERAEFTHRMAYTMAMPVVTALYGALINYMYTGEAPREARDYFFPRTGRLTPKGDEERVTVPSYMKDVLEYTRSPAGTIMSKLHPIFGTLAELYQNKDFYGGLIRDPQHSALGQVGDYANYFGKQMLPFSVRAAKRRAAEGDSSAGSVISSMLGLQPAPGFITAPERAEAFERRQEQIARRRAIRNEALGR